MMFTLPYMWLGRDAEQADVIEDYAMLNEMAAAFVVDHTCDPAQCDE